MRGRRAADAGGADGATRLMNPIIRRYAYLTMRKILMRPVLGCGRRLKLRNHERTSWRRARVFSHVEQRGIDAIEQIRPVFSRQAVSGERMGAGDRGLAPPYWVGIDRPSNLPLNGSRPYTRYSPNHVGEHYGTVASGRAQRFGPVTEDRCETRRRCRRVTGSCFSQRAKGPLPFASGRLSSPPSRGRETSGRSPTS